jgi:hypothetical protein
MTTPRVIEVRRAGNVVHVPLRTVTTRERTREGYVRIANGRKRSIAPQP